jgi:hypothetical protein
LNPSDAWFRVIPFGSIPSSRDESCGFELIFWAIGLSGVVVESGVVPGVEPVVFDPVVVEAVVFDPAVVDPVVVVVVPVVVVAVVVDVLFGLPCVFVVDPAALVDLLVVVLAEFPCVVVPVDDVVVVVILFELPCVLVGDVVVAVFCGLPCVLIGAVAVVVLRGLPCVVGAIVVDEVIVRVLSCFGPEVGAPCVVVTVCGFPCDELPPPRPFASAGENDSITVAAAAHETVRSRICASANDERNRCAAAGGVQDQRDTGGLRELDRQNWQVLRDWRHS